MNLIKEIRKALATDTALTIIRADQDGTTSPRPFATYKVMGDRKGTGRETIEHIDSTHALEEKRNQNRTITISLHAYGKTHNEAYETAQKLRKWFGFKGAQSLEALNVSALPGNVTNRTTFLVDSYDEKYGFDVVIHYIDADQYEIDYFDKVEYQIIIDRE